MKMISSSNKPITSANGAKAASSAHGAAGRYTFWGERDGVRMAVEISARYADFQSNTLKIPLDMQEFQGIMWP